MDEPQKKSTQSEITKRNTRHAATRTEERLEAVLAQFDDGDHGQLSDKQIGKYFALKSKMIDAVRQDHQDLKEMTTHGRKYNLFYLITSGVLVVVVIILLGIFNKDYLGQFMQLLFAFLGGTGVGGYVAKRGQSNDQ